MRDQISTVIELAGLVAVIWGVALLSIPVAVILAGVAAVIVGSAL